MKIEPDTWLSEVLGYNAYRVVELDHDPLFSKEDFISSSCTSSSFYFAKVPVKETGAVNSLCNAGFRVVDVNITFEREPSNDLDNGICSSPVTVRKMKESDRGMLLDIAGSCFVYSRFHLDPFIPMQMANTIKREWVANYIKGNRGNGILVAELNGRPVGFLADLHVNQKGKKVRVIDLIGIDKAYQNRGGGTQLISNFIRNAVGKFSVLRVGTQIANIPSMHIYEKCGFRITEAAYVLHAHVSSGEIIS